MTWKRIIDTGNDEEFVKKADKQEFVYLLFDTNYPYHIIDLAYSLYEISVKYGIDLNTVALQFHYKRESQKGHFTIEKVYTGPLTE